MRQRDRTHPAYWHGAGCIWSLTQPDDPASPVVEVPWRAAIDTADTLSALAAKAADAGDEAGARYCARQAVDLLTAIHAWDDWQCLMSGTRRSESPLAEYRAEHPVEPTINQRAA